MSIYSPPSRTFGELLISVQRSIGDESGIIIDSDDVIRWANDAMDTIVSTNQVLKAKATLPLVSGQADYSLQQLNVHQIDSVHVGQLRIPNIPFAQAEEIIFAQSPAGLGTGYPRVWYAWEGTLTFFPVPNVTDTITLYFTAKPEHIVGSDPLGIIQMPDKYFQAILQYVLQQAHELEEDWQAANAKGTQFSNTLSALGEEERSEQHMTYSTVTVIGDDVGEGYSYGPW